MYKTKVYYGVVTNYGKGGGVQNGRGGGQVKFYPLQKEGVKLQIHKNGITPGGHKQIWCSFNTGA